MNLQIELEQEQLVKLFTSGVLHPSDVKCMNSETKEVVKQMCLKLCQPNRCHRCDRHTLCAQVSFDAGRSLTKAADAEKRLDHRN